MHLDGEFSCVILGYRASPTTVIRDLSDTVFGIWLGSNRTWEIWHVKVCGSWVGTDISAEFMNSEN